MGWKPEVFVEGKWSQNGLTFATEAEAKANAEALWMRWTLCSGHRAVEVADAQPNYSYANGALTELPKAPATVIPADGYADGGTPYSADEITAIAEQTA